MWDTRAPQRLPSAVWRAHGGVASGVACAPSGIVAFTGGADGLVAAWDLRRLGSDDASPLAMLDPEESVDRGGGRTGPLRRPPVTRVAVGSVHLVPGRPPVDAVVAGTAAGDIVAWEGRTFERLAGLAGAHVPAARPATRGGILGRALGLGSGSGSGSATGIVGLRFVAETGLLLSCGGDGVVRLTSLNESGGIVGMTSKGPRPGA